MTKSKAVANKKKATKKTVVRKVRQSKATTPWTPEEDHTILIQRSAGRKFRDIAKDLDTKALAVKNRWTKLFRDGLKAQKACNAQLAAPLKA